jgi:hypothetical protein
LSSSFGFIDTSGEFVIPPTYEDVTDFAGSRARFMAGGKVGYLDPDRREVIPLRFGEAGEFHEGLAAVMEWDPLIHAPDVHRDRAGALRQQKTNPVGYIDPVGEYAIEPAFRFGHEFSEGLAGVSYDGDEWGFIDATGEVRLVDVDRARPFREGYAWFETVAWRKGFLDKDLRVAIQPVYADAFGFCEGLAWVREESDDTGCHFLNPDGDRVLTFDTDCDNGFSNGLLYVREGDLSGFVNRNREWVIPPVFERPGPGFHEGMAAMQVAGKWGFLNTEGDMAIQPRYDAVSPFNSGLAAVRVGALWGFIDTAGDMVIEPRFGDGGSFHEGRCYAALPS